MSDLSEYRRFISAKSQLDAGDGFSPRFMPPVLKDFQASLVDWSALVAPVAGADLLQHMHAEDETVSDEVFVE